ncbi:MAG: bifunctional precorrin-2 dehydrogenase/sirohydrochlorin ferrochelatase [Chloroflexi bacterium]|nr:bifunctional precorrin-2 dehydrogenase/sirohydrochlorin ferrochelatase [Chloroflexota bacterium]
MTDTMAGRDASAMPEVDPSVSSGLGRGERSAACPDFGPEVYPAFLRLAGRRCVVVGGGRVGERKVHGLLAARADVLVVAPRTTPGIDALERASRLVVERHPYGADVLDGAFLAFAATDLPELNTAVVEHARSRGVLVSSADDPPGSDFSVPATVRQGGVTLAVSTGGRSPAFARLLRQELEAWLTPERCVLLDLFAEVRRDLLAAGRNPGPDAWRRAASPGVIAALAAGDHARARERLLAALDSRE